MRTQLWALLVTASLAALPVEAQETRGNINGTVQDASGVIPGATVTITNVDTGQTQTLVTNGSGYFEAPLLQAGPYRVTVDMAGFKGLTQSGITLSVGQSLTLKLTLEVGAISERVDVTAEGAAARHHVGVVGPELRSGADLGTADGGEHADPAGQVRAGRGQPDDPGAGALRADRRPDQRARAPCSAASAASTTRSTAPPTPAAAAASPARPTPT